LLLSGGTRLRTIVGGLAQVGFGGKRDNVGVLRGVGFLPPLAPNRQSCTQAILVCFFGFFETFLNGLRI